MGQLNRHTRYRPATTTRNTDWRCGRVARWTNTPARIFKVHFGIFTLNIHTFSDSASMDAGVRKALTSLKALLDEGFITKAEFGTRRQVILDQATAVQPVAAPQTSADSTGITGLARSVFDRLGEAPQKRGGVFDRLGLPKPVGSIRKPGVHGEQTDLRAKLTGGIKKPGAIRKPGYDTTKPRGPAACPW